MLVDRGVPWCSGFICLDNSENMFSGNKTLDQGLGANSGTHSLINFLLFLPFYVFCKKVKKHILTSVWSAQHPNANRNIQLMSLCKKIGTTIEFQSTTPTPLKSTPMNLPTTPPSQDCVFHKLRFFYLRASSVPPFNSQTLSLETLSSEKNLNKMVKLKWSCIKHCLYLALAK